MRWVVFVRGANVGRHNRFQPALLAKELAHLKIVNVGAAGTLAIFGKVSRRALRSQILQKLPFKPELMICDGKEITELADQNPFKNERLDDDQRAFVTVVAKAPAHLPKLPIHAPAIDGWQVKIIGVAGNAVLSLWRRRGERLLYPNEVVEKWFGEPSTTRSWNTIEKIVKILEG